MKGSMKNKDDLKEVAAASAGASKDYIKIQKGKNFIRLLDPSFVTEYVHTLKGNKFYREFVCLGGIKGGGYAPDVCPACAQAKKHWDKKRELKEDPKFAKSKKLQAEAEYENKQGKLFQTKLSTKMVAVYGSPVKEKRKGGKIKTVPQFEKEAKILNISESQWKKLTEGIFKHKKYSKFMKSQDDLFNRNLLFLKDTEDGSEVKQNTPILIKPAEKTSDAPEITNDLPIIDNAFKYFGEKEAKKSLNEFLKLIGEDIDEEDDEDAEMEDVEDDDLDEDEDEESNKEEDSDDESDDDVDSDEEEEEEEPKKKNKKEKKGKKKKKGKKSKDEDEDDESDDDSDDDDLDDEDF